MKRFLRSSLPASARSLAIGILVTLASLSSKAQYTGLSYEIVAVHDGIAIPTIPAGMVTYRIYAEFVDPSDFLSAIFGLPPNLLSATTTTTFFQSAAGALTGDVVNCNIFPFIPEAEYDSWITIGRACTTDPGGAVLTAIANPLNGFTNFNNLGQNLTVIDGAWFTTNGNVNGQAGADLKILLGQFTTDGVLEVCVNLQVFDDGIGVNDLYYYDQCITATNPCEVSPLEMEASVLENVSCFSLADGVVSVEPVDGMVGNPGYTFDVYETGNPGSPFLTDNNSPIDGLPAGDYYIVVEDSAGCSDTTNTVTITEPDPLEAAIVLVQDNLCFGDEQGEISIEYTGGTAPFEVIFNGTVITGQELVSDLACGDYNIEIFDANQCAVGSTISVTCPPQIVFDLNAENVSCFGQCNGSITGNITGGSNGLSLQVTGPNGFSQTLNGNNSISPNLLNLCDGDYTLVVTDGNDCTAEIEFTLTEPAELSATVTPEDASCNGICDGSATVSVNGGVPAYSFNWGAGNNPNALCADDYVLIVTDANGCTDQVQFTIDEPTPIIVTINETDVTCAGDNDGALSISASGGDGGFQFSIDGPVSAGPQNSGNFNNLPGGNYDILVTDASGCVVTDDAFIFSPNSLTLNIEFDDISCFGADDGSIQVTSGGGTAPLTTTLNGTPGGPVFGNLEPGNYDVVVTDANGCTIDDIVVINEPTELTVQLVSATEVTCGGGCDASVEYQISGGTQPYEAEWNNNPFQDDDELCAGENSLIITDDNGCEAELLVDIIEPDPIAILINAQPVTCTGMTDGSAAVVAVGGTGTLTLDLGALDPEDLNNLPEGEYPVSASDETGCVAYDTIVIVAAIITDMQIQVFSSPVSCWNMDDGTATIAVTGGNPPITYQWDDPFNQTTATAVGLAVENYGVTIVDAIGCTLDTNVTIQPTIGCFFIANVLTPNGDGMNDGWLIGGLEYFPNSTVQVFNRWGQLLFESKGYPVLWDGTYEGNSLPIADYYYVITYDPNEDPITGTVTIKY